MSDGALCFWKERPAGLTASGRRKSSPWPLRSEPQDWSLETCPCDSSLLCSKEQDPLPFPPQLCSCGCNRVTFLWDGPGAQLLLAGCFGKATEI